MEVNIDGKILEKEYRLKNIRLKIWMEEYQTDRISDRKYRWK